MSPIVICNGFSSSSQLPLISCSLSFSVSFTLDSLNMAGGQRGFHDRNFCFLERFCVKVFSVFDETVHSISHSLYGIPN